MIVKDTGGEGFEPPPEGTHAARCVQVIDVGTQHWTSEWGAKSGRKVRLAFELCEEKKVFDEDKGPESIIVSAEYLASLNERANLRKLLESWRGTAFTEEEIQGFDISKLLGAKALVQIVHKTKKGKTYGNIQTITSPPKGMVIPAPTLPLIKFDLEPDQYDALVYDKLPDWLRKKISESDEYREMFGADHANENQSQESRGTTPDDDDSVPF